MKPRAAYNEIDPYAAAWLRNLIQRGLIADGDVLECSIADLRPSDLAGYNQFHTFAGIGIWSLGLRRAGIPDSANVWTGSCPCQPFSAAGKGGGFDDERHLWPAFHHLIGKCRPDVVLGEQVASKDGLAWLDLVQSDMEGTDYAFGAIDTCSAGFGAPHIRQRLRFAAIKNGMANAAQLGWREWSTNPAGCGERSGAQGLEQRLGHNSLCDGTGPVNGFWRDADWLYCRDGKWRPVESGTFPLAHGDPSRVGRLRAFGNAVDAEATTEFCKVVKEAAGL